MSDSISKINLLEKIREICEINTRKKIWEEIQPEDEFQFIVDLIDEELKWKEKYGHQKKQKEQENF